MRQEDYPPGTIVFAKLKGYPWWPARVEDDKNVPSQVISAKSTKSKNPLWTVFFFGSKDYGFFGPDAIKPFHPANVERDLNDKKFKTKDLENAIRQALYPSLQEDDEDEDGEHDQEEKKSQRTRNKLKKKKATNSGKRPSKADEEEEEEMATTTKRRPRKGKPALDPENANSRKKRLKTTPEKSEEEIDNHASSVSGYNGNHASTPGSDKAKTTANESDGYQEYFRDMYTLRHKLQRLVYNKRPGQIPKEDYSTISTVLKSVEDSHMTPQLLRDTKIGSVVKSAGQYMYEDDGFNLQRRCRQLMGRWREQFTPHRHHHSENGNNIRPSPGPTSDTLGIQSATKENDAARLIGPPPSTTDKTKDSSMPIGQVPPVATTPTAT